jgi:7-carboxy-7-deazaguanine synthase
MNDTLFLSDDKVFYTLEGEGKYVGMPSVFMRLSMCNLTCSAFKSEAAPHGCDSYISWSIKNKMSFQDIIKIFQDNYYINYLKDGAILKITGGEPLIQQKQLLKFMQEFVNYCGFLPRIDFETNATITPDKEWVSEFNATFTTSPKLKFNGDPEEKTYKPDVLEWHSKNYSVFKFVVRQEEDVREILEKYVNNKQIKLSKKLIWLMPACGSREEHNQAAPLVAELAKIYNFNFSPRLHLVLWDKALKV